MNQMMAGAIVVTTLLAALFFLRFWRNTRDSFFLYFALSFFLEGVNRLVLTLIATATEDNPLFYTMRVVAYGLIVVAILQKNRKRP